jgi:hypothetical protein
MPITTTSERESRMGADRLREEDKKLQRWTVMTGAQCCEINSTDYPLKVVRMLHFMLHILYHKGKKKTKGKEKYTM